MTVEDVSRHCDVLLDTTLPSGLEGMSERRITAVLGSVATTATVSEGRVWRIEIASPRFRTGDSLGVGTTVAQLRRADARVAVGEGGTFLMRSDHCGLSFQLGGVKSTQRPRLEDVPDTARVTQVLVVGCGLT